MKKPKMGEKRPFLQISLFIYTLFRVNLYPIRCRIENEIFWDSAQNCNMFCSCIIGEKTCRKTVSEILSTCRCWKCHFRRWLGIQLNLVGMLFIISRVRWSNFNLIWLMVSKIMNDESQTSGSWTVIELILNPNWHWTLLNIAQIVLSCKKSNCPFL